MCHQIILSVIRICLECISNTFSLLWSLYLNYGLLFLRHRKKKKYVDYLKN